MHKTLGGVALGDSLACEFHASSQLSGRGGCESRSIRIYDTFENLRYI
jgi:hypothetical protein